MDSVAWVGTLENHPSDTHTPAPERDNRPPNCQTTPENPTVAFSAFYYNFKFLNLTEGQPLAVVRQAIEGLCTRSWEDLSSSYPKENPKRLPKYCANANYILTLLLDAYKFNETSWNNIFFQMKAGGAELGWTLGYMLNLTNMVPAEVPARLKGHRAPLWAAAITFIILTLVLGLAALLLQLWV